MEPENKSSGLTALVTCVTCGLAVILFGLMIYQCYTFPDQTSAFLSQTWNYISTELAFVGTAANFIWFVVTYPFIFAFKAIIAATSIFWISFFCLYLWCSCIAYHLKRKGITTKVYQVFEMAADQLGGWFCIFVYISIVGHSSDFFEGFMGVVAFSLVLVIIIGLLGKLEEEREARRKAVKAFSDDVKSTIDSVQKGE